MRSGPSQQPVRNTSPGERLADSTISLALDGVIGWNTRMRCGSRLRLQPACDQRHVFTRTDAALAAGGHV